MIHETVDSGRMPPWYADPHYGKFANDRRLSKEDKETLLAWIDQGCPRGDDKDLPQPKEWHEGWWIGKPDVVISMDKDFTVPADGGKNGVPYKYFTVPTNFTEDKWVQAAEARPGNRAVVHHIIAFVSEPGEDRRPAPRRSAAAIWSASHRAKRDWFSRRAWPRRSPKGRASPSKCTTRPTASSRKIAPRSG